MKHDGFHYFKGNNGLTYTIVLVEWDPTTPMAHVDDWALQLAEANGAFYYAMHEYDPEVLHEYRRQRRMYIREKCPDGYDEGFSSNKYEPRWITKLIRSWSGEYTEASRCLVLWDGKVA